MWKKIKPYEGAQQRGNAPDKGEERWRSQNHHLKKESDFLQNQQRVERTEFCFKHQRVAVEPEGPGRLIEDKQPDRSGRGFLETSFEQVDEIGRSRKREVREKGPDNRPTN